MYLRTLTLSGCTRNLRIRNFSKSFIKTSYECDLNGSPLLQQFLGNEKRKELMFGLPNRYPIKNTDSIVDGYSCHEVELLGYFFDKHSNKNQSNQDNLFRLETNEGKTLLHRLKVKHGESRIEKLKKGDLLLVKGYLSMKLKNLSTEIVGLYHYIPSILASNLLPMGQNAACNTFSSATIIGRVLLKYFPMSGASTDDSETVGQISILSWLNNQNSFSDDVCVQVNRILISKTTLGLFPFITQLEEGDHLMVTGSLDYLKDPRVDSQILAVNAKQVVRVDRMFARREMN